MNKNIFKRSASALLAVVMCLTTLVGTGSVTAYAAGTGDWDAVKTAFVDGWASEYKLANG